MIKLYFYRKSDSSTQKADDWLSQNKIEFFKQKVVKVPLSSKEIIHILSLVEGRINEVPCVRGEEYKHLNKDISLLRMNNLIYLLEENQKLLRFPILIDEKRMQVGFNSESIRKFIPHDIRMTQRILIRNQTL